MRHLFRFSLGLLATGFLAACAVEPQGGAPPPDEQVGEAESEISVCAGSSTVLGIDVSYYQGSINWTAVKNAGVKFAITRKNDGTFMDPTFTTNWNGIKAAGLYRGAYQYFEPNDNVTTQANVIIAAVGKLGPGDLPVMLDVEQAGSLSSSQYASEIQQWVNLVEAGTGRKPMIYAGAPFWNGNVGSSAFGSYPLSLASYPNNCYSSNSSYYASLGCWMGFCPNTPNGWSKWTLWQYTSEGSVSGISGHVDMDIFDGNLTALSMFADDGYAAQIVKITAPTQMVAGSTATATITYKNVGGQTWNANTKVGTTNPRDRMSKFHDASWLAPTRPAHATTNVAKGAQYAFSFKLQAPTTPGNYTEDFGLVQEGVTWFADQGGPADNAVSLKIKVVAPPPTTTSSSTASSASTTSGATTSSDTTGTGATTSTTDATTGALTGGTGAGGSGSGGAGGGGSTTTKSGCHCALAGDATESGASGAFALVGAALLASRRRRNHMQR